MKEGIGAALLRKLGSRKLWAAAAAAVIGVAAAAMGDSLGAETTALLTRSMVALCVYVFGEGAVDIARLFAEQK